MRTTYLIFVFLFFVAQANAQHRCTTALTANIGNNIAPGPTKSHGCFNCSNATHANWFTFNAPVTGIATISVCGDTGNVDTRVWIYEGSCSSLNQIAADDDGCTGTFESLVSFPVSSSQTYYVEFDDRWSSSGFSFDLSFFVPETCKDTADFSPTCFNNTFSYPASVGQPDASITDPQNDYGCLSTTPNPSWLYFQIDNPGDLVYQITNSNNLDIDYAIWGPFGTVQHAATICADSGYGAPVLCNFTVAAGGTGTLTNVNSNEIYVLLITNFANSPTNIQLSSIGSTATTSCGIVNPGCDTLELSVQIVNSSCVNSGDGSIDLSVNNGVPPFTFQWSNGATTKDLSNLMVGIYSVIVSGLDGCTDTATIVVSTGLDSIPPEINCPANQTVFTDTGLCSAMVNIAVPITSDNCSDVNISNSFTETMDASGTYSVGLTVVAFTAIDSSGNSAQCNMTVQVIDNESPLIECPADTIITLDDALCSAVITYSVFTDDNCPNKFFQQLSGLSSGSAFPVGSTNNLFSITDAAGQTSNCSFSVTIIDNEAPIINCPDNIISGTDSGICGALINFTVMGTDNCPDDTIYQISGLSASSIFPIGVTENVFVMKDGSGLSDTCSFTITIQDTEAPVAICPPNNIVSTDSVDCFATVDFMVSAFDNCTQQNFVITLLSGFDSGNAFPLTSTTNTFEVADEAGNKDSCSFTITVVDSIPPILICPSDTTIVLDDGNCISNIIYSLFTDDNCPNKFFQQLSGLSSGSAFPVGITTNAFSAIDASGNATNCSFDVNVIDLETPVIICPANILVSPDSGQCDAVLGYTVSGNDNCPGDTILQTNGLPSGSQFPVGITLNEFVMIDNFGNSDTCSFTVTVIDNPIQASANVCELNLNNFPPGTIIKDQFLSEGIQIEAIPFSNTPGALILFNTSTTNTPDPDLEVNLGNALIMPVDTNDANNDGLVDVPNDAPQGGIINFYFDPARTIYSFNFIDEDNTPLATVNAYDESDNLIESTTMQNLGDGSVQNVDYNVSGVSRLEIVNNGSGAINSLKLNCGVNQDTALLANCPGSLIQNCSNPCNGFLTVDAIGDSSGYTYLWNDLNSQTTASATGLCAGTYSVTVSGNSGCSRIVTAVIEDSSDLDLSILGSDVSSVGGNDGTADLSVMGGDSPYSYFWSNGATSEDLNNLPAGIYFVTVVDNHDCYRTDSIVINESVGCSLNSTISNLYVSNLNLFSATLNWSVIPGATAYEIIGNRSGSNNEVVLVISGGNKSSKNISGLNSGVTYVWKIRPVCSASIEGSWSPFDTFTTVSCETPVPITTTNITSTSTNLQWTQVAGASRYQIRGRVAGSTSIKSINISDGAISARSISGLSPGTTYEWQIRSKCGTGQNSVFSDYTNFVAFTTLSSREGSKNAIDPLTKDDKLNIFPNPSNGTFIVELKNLVLNEKVEIAIYDMMGKLVDVMRKQTIDQFLIFELEIDQPGTFIIKVENSQGVRFRKVIIK